MEFSDLKNEIIELENNPCHIGIGKINKYIEPKINLIKNGCETINFSPSELFVSIVEISL
jgi:hypothetical protein